MLGWEKGEWSQLVEKNPLERTGGHSLRPWRVYFIRDSEYILSGINKLANKYARLDHIVSYGLLLLRLLQERIELHIRKFLLVFLVT